MWAWKELPYKFWQKKSNCIKDLCILIVQIVVDIKTLCDNEAKRFGVSGKDEFFCNSQKLAVLEARPASIVRVPTEKETLFKSFSGHRQKHSNYRGLRAKPATSPPVLLFSPRHPFWELIVLACLKKGFVNDGGGDMG